MSARRIIAVILAAGQSRRMNRPKLFMPYGEGNILDAVIDAVMESSVDGLMVVGSPRVGKYLDGLLPDQCAAVINDDPASEMLTSVQIGVRAVIDRFEPVGDDGILLLLGDQPTVGAGTVTSLAEAYRLPRRPPGILIATYRGRRGHPTVFSVGLLREVLEWPAERRLNELIAEHGGEAREFPIHTAPIPIDVNTPEDYERLNRSPTPPRYSL